MNVRRFLALTSLLSFFVPSGSGAATASDAETIDALSERYYQYQLATDYTVALQTGTPVTSLRAVTLKNADDDAAFAQSVLNQLKTIDPGKLDHERWLSYRALAYNMDGYVGARKYYWLGQHVAPYSQPFAYALQVFTTYTFKNAADIDSYVKLVNDYAALADSVRDFAQGQHERHIVLPAPEIDPTVAVLAGFISADSSPLAVDDTRLSALPPNARAAAQTKIRTAIAQTVVPAFVRLRAYIDGPYRSGAPQIVGQAQYPGGAEYYAWLVKRSTTLNMTPQQIHDLGLREAQRLRTELDGVRKAVNYPGDVDAFLTDLKTNPRFFATSSDEIGQKLTAFVKRVEPHIPQFYSKTPTAPYGVEALPANLAAGQTFGYYQAPTAAQPRGTYLYNGSSPSTTSIVSAGTLIMHELIPGHHFQISLQQENATLPPFRRADFSVTAYVEGYAEYAAQLGFDMGVYNDPYDHAGRLMQDLMVSSRLVVDTGMNALGWSRERAMEFMRKNTNLNDKQIASETLRYSCDLPAQALAYKIGELTMLRYRDEARQRLGSRFDIRQFHMWLIGSGTMGLDTLGDHLRYEETVAAGH
ncbi:MAG: DUF885 domain-containing protein [Candidatus Eremiobacteraeota bacterium]|nr:DUF885 domain-containing protein [Candidatus Eremiobacteraeota bacterium]